MRTPSPLPPPQVSSRPTNTLAGVLHVYRGRDTFPGQFRLTLLEALAIGVRDDDAAASMAGQIVRVEGDLTETSVPGRPNQRAQRLVARQLIADPLHDHVATTIDGSTVMRGELVQRIPVDPYSPPRFALDHVEIEVDPADPDRAARLDRRTVTAVGWFHRTSGADGRWLFYARDLCDDQSESRWETAAYKELRAFQSGTTLLIVAAGPAPSPSYSGRIARSPLMIYSPRYVAQWREDPTPGRSCLGADKPFSMLGLFDATASTKTVVVISRGGTQTVRVRQVTPDYLQEHTARNAAQLEAVRS